MDGGTSSRVGSTSEFSYKGDRWMMDRTQADVIDLLISVIKEHEKALDLLVGRLEAITPSPEKEMNK